MQAATNYQELACPDTAESQTEPPPGMVVLHMLRAERDAVMAQSLRAAAAEAAAGAGDPRAGSRRPCVVGVVGASHLPGLQREWAQNGACDPEPRTSPSRRVTSSAARVSSSHPDTSAPHDLPGREGGVTGGMPSGSRFGAVQSVDCKAGAEHSAAEAAAPGGGRPERGWGDAAVPPLSSPLVGEPDVWPAGVEAGAGGRLGSLGCRDQAAGVRRALMERLVGLMALPEVCADMQAALPELAPGAAADAYDCAAQLYGAPRMLLACLDREQLAQVCEVSMPGRPASVCRTLMCCCACC